MGDNGYDVVGDGKRKEPCMFVPMNEYKIGDRAMFYGGIVGECRESLPSNVADDCKTCILHKFLEIGAVYTCHHKKIKCSKSCRKDRKDVYFADVARKDWARSYRELHTDGVGKRLSI